MGLSAAAAMSGLPAAAVLLRPRSPRFPFSLSSSSSPASAAVTRLFGRSSSVVPSSTHLKLFSSSSPAAAGERSNNTAALRLPHGCPNCGLQELSCLVQSTGDLLSSQTISALDSRVPNPGQTRSSFRTFATMSSEFAESVTNNPGLHESPDEATKGYFLQQTMYRIKDPKISLDFYTRILGMSLLKRLDFPTNKFSLYFVGYEDAASAPTDPVERVAWTFGKTGTLELTHNWGTESDENFKGHHNGNSDPRGYGHIGITVDDTYKACERFEKLGVKFVKRPDDGKMKGLAFIQDPDGYWIEIFDLKNMTSITKV